MSEVLEVRKVRDEVLHRYWSIVDDVGGLGAYRDVAHGLRRAAVLADALGRADDVLEGRPVYGAWEVVPEGQRAEVAVRGLRWALSGTEVRA